MIGDRVSHVPALKAFHFGIAMAKKQQKSRRIYFLSINNGQRYLEESYMSIRFNLGLWNKFFGCTPT